MLYFSLLAARRVIVVFQFDGYKAYYENSKQLYPELNIRNGTSDYKQTKKDFKCILNIQREYLYRDSVTRKELHFII